MDIRKPEGESKKRVSDDTIGIEAPKPKKPKAYSVKQFRKQIHSSEKLNALNEFASLLKNTLKHDYILDYLKNGGNCLELLQILEGDSSVSPSIIFELVTHILLGISAKYGQYYSSAHESCNYLLKNYLPVIHKMLGLSSSKDERRVCLKLLTAITTFSSSLARDILLNVKFHSANIELLTKHTGEKDSVRDCFIHFLTAFLVDSDLHTLSILLEKSGLLTSIIPGLQYDDANTLCIVITAMKNYILENTSVMKTLKMHVFNTAVVKDIVSLYNWKGPEGLKTLEKNKNAAFEVDKLDKSKVSECVHDFLLVLCTSHKFGVIFRDPSVGLGRKNFNGLMYTVLDSLDRPWEHSYASELVIKICKSCPDLTKNMWAILKPYLEPRLTEKWLSSMNFAKKLIDEMEPSCIEYCGKDLGPQQLAQIVEVLVTPSPILKTLLVEFKTEETDGVKKHIIKLLYHMLEKLKIFYTVIQKWVSIEDFSKMTHYISNYIARHYPKANNLLEDWKNIYLKPNSENTDNEKQEYLETVLDILNLYKAIAPQLLYNLTTSTLDFQALLLNLSKTSEEKSNVNETLQIKLISIFVDIDSSRFLPNTDAFSYVMPILLKTYHEARDKTMQVVMCKLLHNTGIFDNASHEIAIWLDGIFNFNTFTENFAVDFIEILKKTNENMLEYQNEITQVGDADDNMTLGNEELMDNLLNMLERNDDSIVKVKHRNFSPMILGLFNHCLSSGSSKNLKKYKEFVILNIFHRQTNPQRFGIIIKKYQDLVPSNVLKYVTGWCEGQSTFLSKTKGSLSMFNDIGNIFLNSSLTPDMLRDHPYPDFLIDILSMSTFYFTNLVNNGLISETQANNWIFLIHFLIENYPETICLELVLGNPSLINNFNFLKLGKYTSIDIATKAILSVVKDLHKTTIPLGSYLQHYSNKLFQNVVKILKHSKRQSVQGEIKEFLDAFPLAYTQCLKIATQISSLPSDSIVTGDISFILELLTYSLDRILLFCKEHSDLSPIDLNLMFKITTLLVAFSKENKGSCLSKVLKQYLEVFPHSISDIDPDLFTTLLTNSEYDKDKVDLAIFLLQKDLKLIKQFKTNMSLICEKKGVILPIVHVLINNDVSHTVLEAIYENIEASILKAIQKPQKVGQHFAKDYDIGKLIAKFMPLEKCVSFAEKIQKFEVAEIFHGRLLEACYNKIITDSDVNEKQLNNIIMTFIHLQVSVFKRKMTTEEEIDRANGLSQIFCRILDTILNKRGEGNLPQLTANDSFKTFCKFALKFGVSGQYILLTVLRRLLKMTKFSNDDASMLLDMLLSHSEFLNVVLGEHTQTKLEVLSLFRAFCEKWNEFMERSHVAILLSAYRGMVTRCDRVILALLKLYESKPEQTRFYDFKPFLWGRAAATHYSVRTQIGSSLTRQPKISDVLGILKQELVHSTITNCPLQCSLHRDIEEPSEDLRCYDLQFLFPLFSHILAPEQQVKTYMFIRSGALSLTVIGLACKEKEVRQAACHIISRLHFHLEARQTGKDNLLWVRFLEALCKGVAVLPDLKLNSFSAIFFARMALILTNPKHVMFSPLSLYLTAKQDLDLSTVPELYTLLFSPHLEYKEHRIFILDILRDGMKTEKDFLDFLRSMGYKLISELFSSCLSDVDCELLILEILEVICKIPLGVKILTENYSVLTQLSTMVLNNYSSAIVKILPKIFDILRHIVKTRTDKYTNQIVFDMCESIFESDDFSSLKDSYVACFYETIYTAYTTNPSIVRNKHALVDKLTIKASDRFCSYLKKYGCKFITEKCVQLQENSPLHFLRLIIFKLLT